MFEFGKFYCLGTFTIEMTKKTEGEFFPRLDMLNELLKPQRQTAQKLIEEVAGDGSGDVEGKRSFTLFIIGV